MAASLTTPGSSPQLQVDETALAPKQRHARSLKGDRDRVWRERPAAVPPRKEVRAVKEVRPIKELRLMFRLSEASSDWSRSRRHAPAVNSASSHRRTVSSVSSSRRHAPRRIACLCDGDANIRGGKTVLQNTPEKKRVNAVESSGRQLSAYSSRALVGSTCTRLPLLRPATQARGRAV